MRNPFRYFNSSPEVIRLTVMMYIRYPLSLRQVEDLLFERGIDICHETVRFWWNRFGPMFASEIRTRRVRHRIIFELALAFGRGLRPDQRQDTLPMPRCGSRRRGARAVCHKAAGSQGRTDVFEKRDEHYGRPGTIVTDRLRSYGAAMKAIGIVGRHECGRWLNNRAENSYQPLRRREAATVKFRDLRTLQKFAAVHASIQNHFHEDRHLDRRDIFKQRGSVALVEWSQLAA
jgi:putative transposase